MLGESREAISTARHVQFCQTHCMPIAPITTLPIEPFVYLVSILLDLGMSVSSSCHMITSSLLCSEAIMRTNHGIHVPMIARGCIQIASSGKVHCLLTIITALLYAQH